MQAFLTGVGLSLFVELSQFYYMCGAFDVDDLILNSTGALIGALMLRLLDKYRNA
jgi:glycopeptide antibiotics resistance protein